MKLRQSLWALVCAAGLSVIAGVVVAGVANEQIAERIKPAGSVCVAGEKCEGVQVAAAATSSGGAARSGEEIYNTKCMACHGTGAAGAPKLGDAAAWKPRIAQGMDTLIKHAIGGFNMMPPKGTCADCSDAEMKSVVEYMVNKSK